MSQYTVPLRISPPLTVFAISLALYAFIWLLAPLDYNYEGSGTAQAYVSFCCLLFVAALFAGFGRIVPRDCTIVVDVKKAYRLARVFTAVGGLGFALKVFERVVLRGGGELGTNFVENRSLLIEGGSGAMAFVGSTLGAFLILLPIVVFAIQSTDQRGGRTELRLMLLLALAYPLFDLFLLGSRSTFVGFLGMALIASTTFRRFHLTPARAFWTLLFGIAMAWAMAYVFWVRTEQSGMDPVASMYLSGYSTFVPIRDETAATLMRTGASGFGGLKYAAVHASQYLTHGLYELYYAIDGDFGGRTHGLQTFYIPAKIVVDGMLGIEIEALIADGQARPGVYTTLLGPIYYDYGFFGAMVACLLFGWGAGRISRFAAARGGGWLLLHVVVLSSLLFASVVNLFVSSAGQYLLLAALAACALMTRTKFKAFATIRSTSAQAAGRTP